MLYVSENFRGVGISAIAPIGDQLGLVPRPGGVSKSRSGDRAFAPARRGLEVFLLITPGWGVETALSEH
jgi:hypothetical protein